MDYFTKKNRKLLDDIQDPPDIDPLETLQSCFNKWERGGFSAQQLDLQEITISTTARLISMLGNSSAAGHDELDSQVIKLAAANHPPPNSLHHKYLNQDRNFSNQVEDREVNPPPQREGSTQAPSVQLQTHSDPTSG